MPSSFSKTCSSVLLIHLLLPDFTKILRKRYHIPRVSLPLNLPKMWTSLKLYLNPHVDT